MRPQLLVETELQRDNRGYGDASHQRHTGLDSRFIHTVNPQFAPTRMETSNGKQSYQVSTSLNNIAKVPSMHSNELLNRFTSNVQQSFDSNPNEREWKLSHTVLHPDESGKRDSIYARKVSNDSFLINEQNFLGDTRRTLYAIVSPINRNSGYGSNFFTSKAKNGEESKKTEEGRPNLVTMSPSHHHEKVPDTIRPSLRMSNLVFSGMQGKVPESPLQLPELYNPTINMMNGFRKQGLNSNRQVAMTRTEQSNQSNLHNNGEAPFKSFILNQPLQTKIDDNQLSNTSRNIKVERNVGRSPVPEFPVQIARSPTPEAQTFVSRHNHNVFYTDYNGERKSSRIFNNCVKSQEINPSRFTSPMTSFQREAQVVQHPIQTPPRVNIPQNPRERSPVMSPYFPRSFASEPIIDKANCFRTQLAEKSPSRISENPSQNDHRFKCSSFQNVEFETITPNYVNNLQNHLELPKAETTPVHRITINSAQSPTIENLNPNSRPLNLKQELENRSRSPSIAFPQVQTIRVPQHESIPSLKDSLLLMKLDGIQTHNKHNNESKTQGQTDNNPPITQIDSPNEQEPTSFSLNLKDSFNFTNRSTPRDSIYLTNKNWNKHSATNQSSLENLDKPPPRFTNNRFLEISSLIEIPNSNSETPKRMIYSTRSTNTSPKSCSQKTHSTKSILKKPGLRQNNANFFKKKKSVTFNETINSNHLIDRYDHNEASEHITTLPKIESQPATRTLPRLYQPQSNLVQIEKVNPGQLNQLQGDSRGVVRRIKIEDRVTTPRG